MSPGAPINALVPLDHCIPMDLPINPAADRLGIGFIVGGGFEIYQFKSGHYDPVSVDVSRTICAS